MNKKRSIIIKSGLLLSLVIAVACCFVLGRKLTPMWVKWQSKEEVCDNGYTVSLRNKRLSVRDEKGVTIWQSPKDRKYQDFLLTDLDSDGKQDVTTLLWKVGRYGSSRPFWVKEDEDSISQHLFIYDLVEGKGLREKWCSSYLPEDVRRMKLLAGGVSVILTETVEDENLLWRWNDFGISNIDNEVVIRAFGDVIIHEELYRDYVSGTDTSFDFLFAPYKDEIQSADIASFQCESMLVKKPKMISGFPKFGAPMAVGDAVAEAGFDIVVCGSNHSLDKGMTGIDDTTLFYADKNILCPGVQSSSDTERRPYELISRNGMKIAVFSYTYDPEDMDVSDKYPYAVHYLPRDEQEEQQLISDMTKARSESDFIIVYAHWGDEYSTTISQEQAHMADVFAKAGADVVIGTHPHVVQEISTVNRPDGGEMTVYYSLGNFRTYQGFREDTKTGIEAEIILEHTFEGVRIKSQQVKEIQAFVKK